MTIIVRGLIGMIIGGNNLGLCPKMLILPSTNSSHRRKLGIVKNGSKLKKIGRQNGSKYDKTERAYHKRGR